MALKIVLDTSEAEAKFKENMKEVSERFTTAFVSSLNMVASMIKTQGDADISAAGNFGSQWTQGLHVDADTTAGNMRISMYHDIPYANVFEEGGDIKGNPLLWIALSGTDAQGIRASEYPGGLFSVNRKAGGAPLLFSVADKAPKYFGIASVHIPKKFHLSDIVKNAMTSFQQTFEEEMKK